LALTALDELYLSGAGDFARIGDAAGMVACPVCVEHF